MIRHRSPGITSIYNEVKASTRNRVLDLGPMTQGTFQFFSRLSCKIHFENLDEFIADNHDQPLDQALVRLREFLSPHNDEEKFDIILAWDFFNYLELPLIQALLNTLNNVCKKDTLLHWVKYVGQDIPQMPRRFQIIDRHYVQFAEDTLQPRRVGHHQTASLLKALPEYYMHNTLLHVEGMQPGIAEHVLRYMPEKLTRKMHVAQAEVHHGRQKNTAVEQHVSPAIQSLIRFLKARPFARVLDLGAKVTENMDVWRNCCEEVYSEDLFSSIRWRKSNGDDSDNRLSPEALAFDEGMTFDAIIIWDIFNFCDRELLRDIGVRLSRYCKQHTKLIVMAYMGNSIPETSREFHLNKNGTVNLSESKTGKRAQEPITSTAIGKLIPGFMIKHTHVFQPGMRPGICEFVFEYYEQDNVERKRPPMSELA